MRSTNNINIKLSQSLTQSVSHSVSHHFFSPNGLKLSGMLKTDVSNYQKNLLSHSITTEEVSSSHFTNHNYDHNARMNGEEAFSLPNDANSRQKHKMRFTPNAVN